MPRLTDALESAGHRWGCLDLNHNIDRAHVDAELERGRGYDARQVPISATQSARCSLLTEPWCARAMAGTTEPSGPPKLPTEP